MAKYFVGILLPLVGASLFFMLAAAPASAGVISIELAGSGQGTVTGTHPSGSINCSNVGVSPPGPDCEVEATGGTLDSMSLEAQPDSPDSVFTGWTGVPAANTGTCADGDEPECSFIANPLTPDVTVTATFELDEAAPEVEISEVDPVDVTSEEAPLSGRVDLTGSPLTACRFEWVRQADPMGFDSDSTASAACDPDPGDGDGFVDVSATATDLQPNTTYRVRLFADKNATDSVMAETNDPITTDPAAPGAITGKAWSVSDTQATLSARVNPRNSETTYVFEWGTDRAYDHSVPVPAGEAGNGSDPVVVTHQLDGLDPDATYHFRVVAINSEFPEQDLVGEGDDQEFETRTVAEAALPDRGYELVSPVDTNGVPANVTTAALNADRYVYATPPAPGAANAYVSYGVSERSPADDGTWELQPFNLGPPIDPGRENLGVGQISLTNSENVRFSAFLTTGSYDPLDQNGSGDAYLRNLNSGELVWLSRARLSGVEDEPQTDASGSVRIPHTVLEGGPQALFQSSRALVSGHRAPASSRGLYQWCAGELSLVSIDPDDAQERGFAEGQAGLGREGAADGMPHSASEDCSRVVFWHRTGSGSEPRLYLSEDGATREIGGGLGARFGGADSEVSDILFTRNGELIHHSVGEEQNSTITPPEAAGAEAEVLTVSDDADRVYFTTTAELEDQGEAGSENVWLAERDGPDATYEVEFVATATDPERFAPGSSIGFVEFGSDPEGRMLAFRAVENLVPGRDGGGFEQVYAYEADREMLSCISCPADGSAADDEAGLIGRNAAGVRLGTNSGRMSRVRVASNGSVFFQTASQLAGRDTNAAIDVYEWRGGSLALISPGVGTRHAFVGGASADGGSIFFSSGTDPISGPWLGGSQRIWAARVGGGFVAPEREVPCEGSRECRGEPRETRSPSIGSATAGPPPRAAGGDPTAQGRCAQLARRTIAVQRRAMALRKIALRSIRKVQKGSASTKRARVRSSRVSVKRFRVTAKRTALLRRATKRCRGAAQ